MLKKEGNYKLAWKYLKESRKYIGIIFALFLIFILIGYFFPVFFSDFIKKFVEELAKRTEGMNFWNFFVFILQNNLQASFLGLILGIFLGIMPILFVIFNGYVLGFVSNKAVAASGSGILLRLLPHGIFEIPALIISLGLGLKLGMFIFNKAGKRKKEFVYNLENSLRVFLFVILPLLVIAAIIEAALIVLLK